MTQKSQKKIATKTETQVLVLYWLCVVLSAVCCYHLMSITAEYCRE